MPSHPKQPALQSAALRAVARALQRHPRATMEVPGRRQAAVLILLYERDGEPWVVLTERSADLAHHSGEISFPGGARDPEDADLWETAIRETYEELGVDPATIEPLGVMDDYPTFSSRYVVAPYVGGVAERPAWKPNDAEIAQVLEFPLGRLWREHAEEQWERAGARFSMHIYDMDGHRVWGLTAFILHRFLDLVSGELGYR